MTPLAIRMLLDFYIGQDPECNKSDAHNEAFMSFKENDLIFQPISGQPHKITKRGEALVDMLCATPLPELKFVDPRFEEDN